LEVLDTAPGRYAVLAKHYLRAAEFYQSRALYERAAAYVRNAEAAMGVIDARLGPVEPTRAGAAVHVFYERVRPEQIHALQLRAAVLRARLTRNPADIVAAGALLDETHNDAFEDAVLRTYDHSGDICAVGDDPDYAKLASACERDPEFSAKVYEYWPLKAEVDMLAAADPDRLEGDLTFPYSVQNALIVIHHQHDRTSNDSPIETLRRNAGGEDVVQLLLAMADMQIGWAQSRPRNATFHLGEAMRDLVAAERSAQPYENPGRWRQIAARALRVAELYRQTPEGAPLDALRLEAHVRATLAALDAIAAPSPE
jgi:hypothetical protein